MRKDLVQTIRTRQHDGEMGGKNHHRHGDGRRKLQVSKQGRMVNISRKPLMRPSRRLTGGAHGLPAETKQM